MHQLGRFLERVQQRVDAALGAPGFSADQLQLLQATVTQYRQHLQTNPLDEPVALLYLVTQAWQRPLDEQVERVAAFCSLFLFAADLLDDVQDDDLQGKSHAEVTPALATNNAVTLLFLALRELHEAVLLESSESRRAEFLRLVDRLSLVAVSGQHRDLTRSLRARTREAVLEMQMAKTASITLIVECGALLARCDEPALTAYREAGKQLAGLVQLRDDLRDVFGKAQSPDLRDGKLTYPMACLLERATPEQRTSLDDLLSELPSSLDRVRALLYDSGAVAETALAMERCRQAVHEQISSTNNNHAAHRTLLDVTNTVAESIYVPEPVVATQHLWSPEGRWHRSVRESYRALGEQLTELGLAKLPALRPWHAPQWMYSPQHTTIFYPDLEQQSDEVLPFHARLLGNADLEYVGETLFDQLSCVLVHELFHSWRDAAGRLSDDHWHEEWVANRLTVAYLQHYQPERLQRTVELAKGVIARFPKLLDERVEAVLSRCQVFCPNTAGYAMSQEQVVVTEFHMIARLAAQPVSLRDALQLVAACGSAAA